MQLYIFLLTKKQNSEYYKKEEIIKRVIKTNKFYKNSQTKNSNLMEMHTLIFGFVTTTRKNEFHLARNLILRQEKKGNNKARSHRGW